MNTIRTKRITNFKQGMTPNLYGDGFTRLEHFDTVTEQARPFRTLQASTSVAYGSNIVTNALNSIATISGVIYALGMSDSGFPAMFKWNSTQYEGVVEFGSGSSANGLVAYTETGTTTSYLVGLYNGTNIYKCTTGGVVTPTYADLTYTTFANPIVHTKNNTVYFFVDNKVYTFTGTSGAGGATLALTLPPNFRITSACEDGEFIFIVGYDVDGKATGYLWNRSSTLNSVTAKYDLGYDIPYHCGRVGQNTFIVSGSSDSTNSPPNPDKKVLTIRYRNGDTVQILNKFQFLTLGLVNTGRLITNDSLFFSAYIKTLTDTSAKNVIFGIDSNGKLSIVQNVGVNTSSSNPPIMTGIYSEGDGWWIAGKSDGSWNSVNSFTTTSAIETTKIRSDDLSQDVGFVGCVVSCEALPTAGQIVVSARKNEQTAWTTLDTFTTDNGTKFAITALKARNALNGINQCNEFQLRVESTGGAVITGFQYAWEEIKTNSYG